MDPAACINAAAGMGSSAGIGAASIYDKNVGSYKLLSCLLSCPLCIAEETPKIQIMQNYHRTTGTAFLYTYPVLLTLCFQRNTGASLQMYLVNCIMTDTLLILMLSLTASMQQLEWD